MYDTLWAGPVLEYIEAESAAVVVGEVMREAMRVSTPFGHLEAIRSTGG